MSATIRVTYFVPVALNVKVILHPVLVCIVAPVESSNCHAHDNGASPVELVPSSVTAFPTVAPVGAVH